jgi:ribonuclease VapC
MIIDSSAIVAILHGEPETLEFLHAIDQAPSRRMSAATFVEAAIVVDGQRDPILSRDFDSLCERIELIIEPFTDAQAKIAREAYRDFGKKSKHPAKLNFGDCFAYALAKTTRELLLYKGNDFIHTDIKSALD